MHYTKALPSNLAQPVSYLRGVVLTPSSRRFKSGWEGLDTMKGHCLCLESVRPDGSSGVPWPDCFACGGLGFLTNRAGLAPFRVVTMWRWTEPGAPGRVETEIADFETIGAAFAQVREECRWEGTVSVRVSDRTGRTLLMRDGDFR